MQCFDRESFNPQSRPQKLGEKSKRFQPDDDEREKKASLSVHLHSTVVFVVAKFHSRSQSRVISGRDLTRYSPGEGWCSRPPYSIRTRLWSIRLALQISAKHCRCSPECFAFFHSLELVSAQPWWVFLVNCALMKWFLHFSPSQSPRKPLNFHENSFSENFSIYIIIETSRFCKTCLGVELWNEAKHFGGLCNCAAALVSPVWTVLLYNLTPRCLNTWNVIKINSQEPKPNY